MNKTPRSKSIKTVSAKNTAQPHFTTETLEAIEWDLRSRFDFGDLRPFEFCIGAKLVRFPDRTDLNNPQANTDPKSEPTPDFPARTDHYIVVAHVFPPGFEPTEEVKKQPRKTAKTADATEVVSPPKTVPTRRKKPNLPTLPQPPRKDGEVDWAHFLTPKTSGHFPYNTVLPNNWQYGDPIPGALVE